MPLSLSSVEERRSDDDGTLEDEIYTLPLNGFENDFDFAEVPSMPMLSELDAQPDHDCHDAAATPRAT